MKIFFLFLFLLFFTAAAAWLTHIIYSIVYGMWLALIAGAILVPVGVIHGILIWFGYGYGIHP